MRAPSSARFSLARPSFFPFSLPRPPFLLSQSHQHPPLFHSCLCLTGLSYMRASCRVLSVLRRIDRLALSPSLFLVFVVIPRSPKGPEGLTARSPVMARLPPINPRDRHAHTPPCERANHQRHCSVRGGGGVWLSEQDATRFPRSARW